MKKCALLCALMLISLTPLLSQTKYATSDFRIAIDKAGSVTSLFDIARGKEYMAKGHPAPLLSVLRNGKLEKPAKMAVAGNALTFQFTGSKTSIDVAVVVKPTHLTFEVVSAKPLDAMDGVVWGPYSTSITKAVGEVVGVVRDDQFAIGIQALNPKTVGSYPENAEGFGSTRGGAATRQAWGSDIQCYSLNREKSRKADVWGGGFPNMPIPPIPGETVVGSKIALFGCAEPKTLDRIGEIEVAEGLPHPMVNGVWWKKSPDLGRSYLIADYDEQTIDTLLAATKQANLMTLYHMEPFASWGHYEISTKKFPDGVAGFRRCLEKAKALGIRLGAHTLTTFIQTWDPYVTPVPDPRLAKTGTSTLTEDVSDSTVDIAVASPEYFANEKANWLHAAVIDKEIVRYRAVSEKAPWVLYDCQRGAFGTKASAHSKGTEIGKLLDHPYQTFYPNFDLQREIARNMAKTFNETGLSQMDFDGHEGCASTGQGDYACDLFAKDFYDNLDHPVLNGSSNIRHYYWHINSYINWGEPWYEGFRESMQEYRIKNQELFDRNFMPHMFGWYLLTETTSLSDIEWMLARTSGYNAGFALATNIDAFRKNQDIGPILDAIREWEAAKRGNAFSTALREQLKDPKREFHLEVVPAGGWLVCPYHDSQPFRHEKLVRQPGEPVGSHWEYKNPDQAQPMQFKLRVTGDSGVVANPKFEFDRFGTVMFPVELTTGQTLLCEGTAMARVYDGKGRQVKTVQATGKIPVIKPGRHEIQFDCEFKSSATPAVVVTFKTKGEPEKVTLP
jgi:hypothetical protein